MTKGLMDTKKATMLHLNGLPIIVFTSFIIHSFFAIRLTFKRWRVWDSFGKYLLPIVWILLIAGFIYIHFFYEQKDESENTSKDTDIEGEILDITGEQEESDVIYFTSEELGQYDGTNGTSQYVAVDGIVYDMSEVFESGEHYSHFAGEELTSEFYSYHELNEITKYPVVGEME